MSFRSQTSFRYGDDGLYRSTHFIDILLIAISLEERASLPKHWRSRRKECVESKKYEGGIDEYTRLVCPRCLGIALLDL